MRRRLPVFPLGSVLLPYGLLPLHIFENRYRALMTDLLEGDGRPGQDQAEMGVVLIERGHEVGGGDERSTLGTVAQIMQAEKLPDGRWLVVAAGTRRFSVSDWLPDDPYPRAEVEELPPEQWDEMLTETLATLDDAARQKKLERAIDAAMADQPVIPVFYPIHEFAAKKELVVTPRAQRRFNGLMVSPK